MPEITLRAAAVRYWPAILVLATLLAAWIFYTVRVEHLVHARTAELRQALDERKAIEARMRIHQEQVEHLSRLSILGELSGTLAHEINQPLASIGNYAQSLVRRVDNGRLTDAAVREASIEIAGHAERAAGILGRIRGFARKRAAVREHRLQPNALLREGEDGAVDSTPKKPPAPLTYLLAAIFVVFCGILICAYVATKRANPVMLDSHGKPLQSQGSR